MGLCLETLLGNIKMAGGRCANMHYVRLDLTKHLGQVAIVPPDRESLGELAGHKMLAVTNSNNLAALDPLDLGTVVISDLSTADDSHSKHRALPFGKPQSSY